MAERRNGPEGSEPPIPLNPEPRGPNPNPTLEETEQAAFPAEGAPGQPVVQINVEEDMRIGGGSKPVREGETVAYGVSRKRTVLMVGTAVIVALFLALPIIWVLVELVVLAGVIGPWIWAWAILLVVLIIATVLMGYRIGQSGL